MIHQWITYPSSIVPNFASPLVFLSMMLFCRNNEGRGNEQRPRPSLRRSKRDHKAAAVNR